MVNPFKPEDKVLIFRKGIELEATVRSTWNHEVQVRVADGELLWRTVKTTRLVVEVSSDTAPADEAKPVEDLPATEEIRAQELIVMPEPEILIEPEPVQEQTESIPPPPAAEEASASDEAPAQESGKAARSRSGKKAKKRGKNLPRRNRSGDPF